jgi:type II secretory ATPase GspE/PulE/Tfp pilus assembly ATPase PilB-like protein
MMTFGDNPLIDREAVIDHLLDNSYITREAVARAEAVATRTRQPLERVLNQLGQLSDDDLALAYAAVTGLPLWEPSSLPALKDYAELGLGQEFLRRVRAVPLYLDGEKLACAAVDPFDDEMRAGLSFATGREVVLHVARPADWRAHFEADPEDIRSDSFLDERRVERDLAFVEDHSVEGQAVELVQLAFAAAVDRGASDIHFEPRRNDLLVRLRVDGRLVDFQTASADLSGPCVSRIKVLSNLNVGERRLPQDGRASIINAGRSVDVRVATSPTVFGESAVMRLLDRAQAPQDVSALHLPEEMRVLLDRAVRTPHGLFLVTGPTGSGKTTTLYALLNAFRGSGKKILSVEDPVERHFEHVSQTQVQANIGLSFATCLRAFLRHDPDVILVGEIRDAETAAVAVQAAMTGHLVLASVHANTALAVAPRLVDMGIAPYQLTAALKGVIAQRLVRKLCPHCKTQVPTSGAFTALAHRFGLAVPETEPKANGCAKCRGLGYSGRIALAEGFWADDAFLALVGEGAHLEALKIHSRGSGQTSMVQEGLVRVMAGDTTFDEILLISDD